MVCHNEDCYQLSSSDGIAVSSSPVPELHCHQEEADTRLFLHASHAAASGASVVIIRSPDTDVAIIGCHLAEKIPAQLLMHTGTKQRHRYINLTAVADRLSSDVCAALPGMHAFTSCDTTSAFSGRGKKTAFKLLFEPDMSEGMAMLGEEFTISDQLKSLCGKFVCVMYGKLTVANVNELRYQIFRTNPSQSSGLPPTEDALFYHMCRANYQAALWKRALQTDVLPGPVGHGWETEGGEEDHQEEGKPPLVVKWSSRPAAPQALLELISCGCSTGCASQRCRCKKSNLPCTAACRCSNCSNCLEDNTSQEEADIGAEEAQ